MSLVILTITMFATIALSRLLITEINSARYLDSSVVAHYAAESAAEEMLWFLKESKGLDELVTPYPYYLFFNRSNTLNRQLDRTYISPSPYADKDRLYDIIKISTTSPEYVVYDLPIFSSAQLNVFDPTQETPTVIHPVIDTQANQLKIDWEVKACGGSQRLEVSLVTFQNASGLQFGRPQKYYFICDCTGSGVTPNQCNTTISRLSLTPSKFYHVSIRPIDDGLKRLSVTTDNSAGLPSLVSIQTRGRFRNASQEITVTTPFNPALSDIFQYVIFSEASIIKNVTSPQLEPYGALCGVCADTGVGCSQHCGTANCQQRAITDTVQPVCFDTVGSEAYGSDITQTNSGRCNARCTGYTVCGDGQLQSPNGVGFIEQCDDGDISNLDTCTNECRLTTCGDGYVNRPNGAQGFTEVCDDGAANSNSVEGACNLTCSGIVIGVTPPQCSIYQWACTNWTPCTNGFQRRVCTCNKQLVNGSWVSPCPSPDISCRPPTNQTCIDLDL